MIIEKQPIKVFLGLGGNLGEPSKTFDRALRLLSEIPEICNLEVSKYYRTSPVSAISQPDYLNAVCVFWTTLQPKELFQITQEIERKLGKVPKPKDAPRKIDLDLLLYGELFYCDEELEIPHPRWSERVFVTMPMSDLVDHVMGINLKEKRAYEKGSS